MSTKKKTWHDVEKEAIQCLISITGHMKERIERGELGLDSILDAAKKADEIARFSREMQKRREGAECIARTCEECWNMPYTGERS